MSLKENEKLAETFVEFLDERNLTEGDIMSDERGKYYLAEDNDTGEMHKLYLPLNFQEL